MIADGKRASAPYFKPGRTAAQIKQSQEAFERRIGGGRTIDEVFVLVPRRTKQ